MKAIATALFHHFNMKLMVPVNTSVTQCLDVKFSSDVNKRLLITAISGERSYENEFKKLLMNDIRRWDNICTIVENQVMNSFPEDVQICNSCKILVQFPDVVADEYFVIKDVFGGKYGKFISKDDANKFN